MLTDPSLEQLLPKASCAYELAVLVSKRASQIVDGAQPMIPDKADNEVSLACKEILENKVEGVKGILPKDAYSVPLTREAKLAIEAEKKSAMGELQSSVADLSVDVASRLVGTDLSDADHRAIIERYINEAGSFNGN